MYSNAFISQKGLIGAAELVKKVTIDAAITLIFPKDNGLPSAPWPKYRLIHRLMIADDSRSRFIVIPLRYPHLLANAHGNTCAPT